MSVSGSISRHLELCSIRWERHIPEQGPTSTLTPGWHLTVRLPLIDLSISDFGHPLKNRFSIPVGSLDRTGGDLYIGGFAFGLGIDNGNDAELVQDGDCTVLG